MQAATRVGGQISELESRKRQRDACVAPAGDGEDNGEEQYFRGRRRRRSFSASSQDSSFDEKLWTTSQETIPDTDNDDNDDELDNCDDAERHSKRWCLASSCNHNDPSWKSPILDNIINIAFKFDLQIHHFVYPPFASTTS